MNKKYKSPELEIVKFRLSADVMTISQGENTASGGFYNEPGEEEENEG